MSSVGQVVSLAQLLENLHLHVLDRGTFRLLLLNLCDVLVRDVVDDLVVVRRVVHSLSSWI